MTISSCINLKPTLSRAINGMSEGGSGPGPNCDGIEDVYTNGTVELAEGIIWTGTAELNEPISLQLIDVPDWMSVEISGNEINISTTQAFAPSEYNEVRFYLYSAEGCRQEWFVALTGTAQFDNIHRYLSHMYPTDYPITKITGVQWVTPIWVGDSRIEVIGGESRGYFLNLKEGAVLTLGEVITGQLTSPYAITGEVELTVSQFDIKQFVDTFTDTPGTYLENHTTDSGDFWYLEDSDAFTISSDGYLYSKFASYARASFNHNSVNYSVEAEFKRYSLYNSTVFVWAFGWDWNNCLLIGHDFFSNMLVVYDRYDGFNNSVYTESVSNVVGSSYKVRATREHSDITIEIDKGSGWQTLFVYEQPYWYAPYTRVGIMSAGSASNTTGVHLNYIKTSSGEVIPENALLSAIDGQPLVSAIDGDYLTTAIV